MMKAIFCLCFCGLSIALYAQSALQTFTSPDGAFQFKHSAMLIPCTPIEGQVDVPQGCICDDHQGSAVIVCFTYPGRSEYFFGVFFVAEVQPQRPRKDCLEGSSNWWPPQTARSITRGQNTRIGSVRARLFHVSDAGLGSFESGDIYMVFHGNKCYELGIRQSGVTSTPFDPEEFEKIEKVEKEDYEKYGPLLSQALHSFHFVAGERP
jgi:hypothetical protein